MNVGELDERTLTDGDARGSVLLSLVTPFDFSPRFALAERALRVTSW